MAETRRQPGAMRPGSTYDSVVRVAGGRTFHFEVSEYEPPRRAQVRATSGFGMLPTVTYDFAARGTGTELSVRIGVRTAGLFRLLEPVMPGQIRKNWSGYLAELKRVLETS